MNQQSSNTLLIESLQQDQVAAQNATHITVN